MQKKKLLIIGLILFLLLGLTNLALQQRQKLLSPSQEQLTPTPSSEGFKKITSKPLVLISSDPADASTELPLSQTFTLHFNRLFEKQEVVVSFSPQVVFTATISGDYYHILPSEPLYANQSYSMYVRIQDKHTTPITFSTVTDASQPAHDFVGQQEIDNQRQNYPDQYLQLFLPYETPEYSVSSYYVSTPAEHFAFTVTIYSKNAAQAKNDFYGWLMSLGLTQGQIKNLEVSFQ